MLDISVQRNNMIDAASASKGNSLMERMKTPSGPSFEEHLEKAVEGSRDHKKKPVDRKLMDACVEMESLFVSKMLKEMRKTVHKTDWLNGGFAEEIFEDMLYDEYSKSVSQNADLGLAKMLYNEMSRK
jgi:flagellar protein FlgJ